MKMAEWHTCGIIGNESVRGIMPSSFSAVVGLTDLRGSRKRLSSAKTYKVFTLIKDIYKNKSN